MTRSPIATLGIIAFVWGCSYAPSPPSGTQTCDLSGSHACPGGYYCVKGICWRNGDVPRSDASTDTALVQLFDGSAAGAGGKIAGSGGMRGSGGAGGVTISGDIVTFTSGRAVGVISGYGWVALGSLDTVTSPTCGAEARWITASSPCASLANWSTTNSLCISGNVPVVSGDSWNDNWGIQIGINITEPPGGTIQWPYTTITLDAIEAISPTTSGLRAILHRSGDDPATTYCAPLTPGVPIPLTNFNTACWKNSGIWLQAGDVPSIDKVGVQISSDAINAYNVSSYCLTRIVLGPSQGAGSGAGGFASTVGTGGSSGSGGATGTGGTPDGGASERRDSAVPTFDSSIVADAAR